MPRQIDLFPQNLSVNHDPTKQLGITAAQYENVQAGIPAALEKAEIVFINSVLAAIDEVTGWNLLAFAEQVEAGITDTGNFATDFWNYLLGTNTTATNAWANWTTLLEELGLPDATAVALVSWLQTLLEPNSPLNAGNLWGLLPFNLFGLLPSTSVTSIVAQPLYNPNFESAISVSPGSGWSWDSTVYYFTSVNMPGSAKVVADGTTHGLRANTIPVQGGQTIAVTAQILTSGLTATGSPIEVDVITFKGNTQVAQTTEASSGAPSGATTSWINPPGGSVAGTLTGSYLVPDDGTVDSLLVRLGVGATATAGSVWFGSVSVEISGGYLATIEGDLSALSDDFTAGNTAFATFLQSVLTDIDSYTTWSTFITDLESQWNTYITTATSLTSAEFFTLQQLLDTLLGINATTGLTPQTQVDGLTAIWDGIFGTPAPTGSTQLLQTAIADLGDAWTALFGSSSTPTTGSQVLQTAVQDLSNAWTALFGSSSTPTTGSQVLQTAVQDLGNAWTALFGSSSTPTTGSQVIQTAIQDLDNAWIALFGSSSTPTTSSQVQAASVTNVLGNGSLGADLTSLATSLFGSSTVNAITTVEQDIANFFSNAISGGSAPTSTDSPVAYLEGLLGIIPHTNVVIPASPGSGMITWDNANAHPTTQFSGPATSLETLTWNHTCGATANYLVVRIAYYSGGVYPIVSVTYNGNAMQLLGTTNGPDAYTHVAIYGMPNPATGSAMQVAATVYTAAGSYIQIVAAESDSYIDVGSVGSSTVSNGVGTSPSLTATSASGDYIVQAFAISSLSQTETLTSYTATGGATLRYNSTNIVGPAENMVLLAGDAAGASSVTFSATAAHPSTADWAGIAVNLIPLPSTVLGSTFRAANTSTSTVSANSGGGYFPSSFFNTTVNNSSDLTYAPGTVNTVTITHAGTYSVTIAVLLYDLLDAQWIGLNLIQTPSGGSPTVKRGNTQYVAGTSSSTVYAHTFQVYCGAGDTLAPGYYSSFSGSAFVGTTDGLSTYFEVSLNNRGLLA